MIYLDGYVDLPLTIHTWAAFLFDPGSSDMLFDDCAVSYCIGSIKTSLVLCYGTP